MVVNSEAMYVACSVQSAEGAYDLQHFWQAVIVGFLWCENFLPTQVGVISLYQYLNIVPSLNSILSITLNAHLVLS